MTLHLQARTTGALNSAFETSGDARGESTSAGWQRRSGRGAATRGCGIDRKSGDGNECQEVDVVQHFVR